MFDQLIAKTVERELRTRSEACERGILAVREDQAAAIATVNPNCLMYVETFFGGAFTFEMVLN